MKSRIKQKVVWIILTTVTQNVIAQVGINVLNPHPSAALQVEAPVGTFKGLLTPSMTALDRTNIASAPGGAEDGLIVYDVDHKMHYYYNALLNRWVSMSPFTLSTPANSSSLIPSGVITTPYSFTTFSIGINKQNPTQALDVFGNSNVSGNMNVGGNIATSNNASITGNATVNGVLSVNGFANNALMPTGAIIMWAGNVAPPGWAICDGTSGTPDLRGRFIVGMDNSQSSLPNVAPNDGTTVNYGAIGNKGGETGHILSLAEMPEHKHNVSSTIINGSQGNNLTFQLNAGCSGCNATQSGGSGQYIQENYLLVNTTESLRGSDQIHENRPPYYVLAYIIKLP